MNVSVWLESAIDKMEGKLVLKLESKYLVFIETRSKQKLYEEIL